MVGQSLGILLGLYFNASQRKFNLLGFQDSNDLRIDEQQVVGELEEDSRNRIKPLVL